MNPDKQRIAIARACGWENSQTDSKTCYNPHGEHCYWSDVPDYLNDLNAMAEAEQVLTPNQWNAYVNRLDDVINPAGEIQSQPELDFKWVTATAAQRAEAFLRTIGKWEDDK